MNFSLRFLSGANAGREIKVASSEFVIGREKGCHLRPSSKIVSRKHCMLAVRGSALFVRDLDSRNGTFINDERIDEERELKAEDRLRLADLEFSVQTDEATVLPDVGDSADQTVTLSDVESDAEDETPLSSEPGKLSTQQSKTIDSQEAAGSALRDLFNRRR